MTDLDPNRSEMDPTDEPYWPDTGDARDDQEILRLTRGSGSAPLREAASAAGRPVPGGGGGRSLLGEVPESFGGYLEELEKRLDSGGDLTAEDVERLTQRAALRLLRSRRPAAVAAALKLLERSAVGRHAKGCERIRRAFRGSLP